MSTPMLSRNDGNDGAADPSGPVPIASVCVRADRDGLASSLQLVKDVCAQVGVTEEDAHSLRLAVEEACANVVMHAYVGRTPGRLDLSFYLTSPDVIAVCICDDGVLFHPDRLPRPDLSASLEDRPIGGLGWLLIRQAMTSVDYHRTPQGNCLTLRLALVRPVRIPHLNHPSTGSPTQQQEQGMSTSIESQDPTEQLRIIGIHGRMDIQGSEEISMKFCALSATVAKQVIVDLSDVSFLASIGIRSLITNAKALQQRGGAMFLVTGDNAQVARTLEATGINDLIPVFASMQDAQAAAA